MIVLSCGKTGGTDNWSSVVSWSSDVLTGVMLFNGLYVGGVGDTEMYLSSSAVTGWLSDAFSGRTLDGGNGGGDNGMSFSYVSWCRLCWVGTEKNLLSERAVGFVCCVY